MIDELYTEIRDALQSYGDAFYVEKDSGEVYQVRGTIPTMQGKKKVDGMYFATIMKKAMDVRYYFFPLYTHPDNFSFMTDELRALLKGKTCFHLKPASVDVKDVKALIQNGVEIYRREGWMTD